MFVGSSGSEVFPSFIEQAFDALLDAGFHMVGACASSTNSAGGEVKPGTDVEESRWNHYNEFVFVRPSLPNPDSSISNMAAVRHLGSFKNSKF